jgi:hypothetical protein
MHLDRRKFTAGLAAAAAVPGADLSTAAHAAPTYRGPNVIIIRFGGGVRRRETIVAGTTFAPFLFNILTARAVLIPSMMIAQLEGVDTSHAEGTLNILTGRYRAYRDAGSRFLAQHLEPTEPTLFEYFRRAFDVPAHQALLVNGEDRPQEEFFSYGVHKTHGIAYRSEVLSLYRFKLWKLRTRLSQSIGREPELSAMRKELQKLERHDYRGSGHAQALQIEAMWQRWQDYYGDSGLKNPRGDSALTELAIWALRYLRPHLMMINYQDPDYVHWGNATHYSRAIALIDKGVERLVGVVDADPQFRDRTVFVIVPDCGRDANPLMSVPFQHHFNSRSAHEIWALVLGPGIAKGRVLDKPVDQSSIAATVGAIMGFRPFRAEGRALDEVLL